MNEVFYRDLNKSDYESIKRLICEGFKFDEFVSDKKFLDIILNQYLQSCILSSSFSKVAEKDNKVIGIILGEAKNDKKRLGTFSNNLSFLSSILKLIFASKENRKIFKEFLKVQKAYSEIIKGKKHSFQGAIQLFIVSKESRGLGVGKKLVNYVFDYMNKMNVDSIYLYTDDRCNYGFYDSQNFNRVNEKKIYFDTLEDNLNIFLYSYDFK